MTLTSRDQSESSAGRAKRPTPDQADLQLVQALSHVLPQPSLVLRTSSGTTGLDSTMVTSRSKSASPVAFVGTRLAMVVCIRTSS
jgi:hypothetical protein